jgi:ribonuclease R
LIHCSSLTDDFYEFDETRGMLTGRRNRRVFRLGDKVEVQIAKVDSFKKQVDFRLARAERPDRDDRYRPQQGGSQRPPERQQQRPQQRFQDRQQPRRQSRAPQQKSRHFKSQSNRPPLPARDSKSRPARPQSGGGNIRAGSARPQIPSSHSRLKFGGRRRR